MAVVMREAGESLDSVLDMTIPQMEWIIDKVILNRGSKGQGRMGRRVSLKEFKEIRKRQREQAGGQHAR
jgi:hypothetical protein